MDRVRSSRPAAALVEPREAWAGDTSHGRHHGQPADMRYDPARVEAHGIAQAAVVAAQAHLSQQHAGVGAEDVEATDARTGSRLAD